ncbi:DUF6053 domain-containing protein [Lysobacter enzymogenes]|uniref:DUF6053 domain-containing protein n=1 Tax=Lysobacter enzymogenes TaxID=69 RepID=UPI003D18D954
MGGPSGPTLSARRAAKLHRGRHESIGPEVPPTPLLPATDRQRAQRSGTVNVAGFDAGELKLTVPPMRLAPA